MPRVCQIAKERMQPLYDDALTEGYRIIDSLSADVDEYITERTWKFDWDVSIYTNPQTVPPEALARLSEEELTEAMVAQRDLARREMRVQHIILLQKQTNIKLYKY